MSKISEPRDNSQSLTDEELAIRVPIMLEPMIREFEKEHKGKEITKSDIQGLYKNLSDYLSKDPRVQYKDPENSSKILDMMAGVTADKIQKDKSGISAKLIGGFGDFCKKIGLEKIGTACIKHVQKTNLKNQTAQITKDLMSTRAIKDVGAGSGWLPAELQGRLDVSRAARKRGGGVAR